MKMLEFGNSNRTQHPTDANATSSRSHAVFQVSLINNVPVMDMSLCKFLPDRNVFSSFDVIGLY